MNEKHYMFEVLDIISNMICEIESIWKYEKFAVVYWYGAAVSDGGVVVWRHLLYFYIHAMWTSETVSTSETTSFSKSIFFIKKNYKTGRKVIEGSCVVGT